MKDRIQAILAREIAKLDTLSIASPEPLPAREVKSLDVLIRAYRTLTDPASNPPPTSGSAQPAESDPASQSNDALLTSLTEPQA